MEAKSGYSTIVEQYFRGKTKKLVHSGWIWFNPHLRGRGLIHNFLPQNLFLINNGICMQKWAYR